MYIHMYTWQRKRRINQLLCARCVSVRARGMVVCACSAYVSGCKAYVSGYTACALRHHTLPPNGRLRSVSICTFVPLTYAEHTPAP